jgi:hypothetical protein
MINSGPDAKKFEALSRELVNSGIDVRFEARGASMSPSIRDGQVVHVTAVIVSKLQKGDIVLTKGDTGFLLHRLVVADHRKNIFVTRGDCGRQDDCPVRGDQILGVALAKEITIGRTRLRIKLTGFAETLLRWFSRARWVAGRAARGAGLYRLSPPVVNVSSREAAWPRVPLGILLMALLCATPASAQVIFVGATPGKTAELTSAANTISFSQTLLSQTNRFLVFGISLNVSQSTTSAVTSITDNGTAVTNFIGGLSDNGNKVRMEMWSLTAPPVGVNNIVITVSVPTGTVGAVAASAYFSNVNQTTPLETFASANGQGSSEPSVTATSAAGELVIDTVATFGNITLTPGSGQVQKWQASSGVATTDVDGAGSIKAGAAPTVTMSWTRSALQKWALGAVSVRPATYTAVEAHGFEALQSPSGTLLRWQTGREVRNLGFNVYREQNGERVRLNLSLIAGSALLMSGALPKHSGKTYAWIDSSSKSGSCLYWLEDVDVNGTRTLHGPVTGKSAGSLPSNPEAGTSNALTFDHVNQAQLSGTVREGSHTVENVLREFEPTPIRKQTQFELAAHPAVKIFIKHAGWHRITQPELIQAGLDPNVDPALLHLYAEAVEHPMQITGASSGPGGFGPQATLEFYGTGIDTPYSGTRVYWLVAGDSPGRRVPREPRSTGPNQPPASFRAAVEVTPHTTYFPALITSDGNNFFGQLVSSTPADQIVSTPMLDKNSTQTANLEVILQGVITASSHDISIALNGTSLGNLTFAGQDKGKFHASLPPGILIEGDNTVTLTAQGGEYDTSLVQSIRIQYPRLYIANADRLTFTGRAGDELKAAGFTSAPGVVLDITDPDQPVELTPQITSDRIGAATQYSLYVQVPSSTTNAAADRHTLLAAAADRFLSAAGVRPNHPSHWHRAQPGGEIVMVSYAELAGALNPVVQAHQAQGQSTALVLIDDLYDEFNFGERDPAAVREFLRAATKEWDTAPRYLLLNGRASIDPRNYLGFGHFDLVPTKIVPTSALMTASDDWFSDFNDTGVPTIATGRLPVSTPDEAGLVAGKIAAYYGQATNGPWTSRALVVADVNDTENFTRDSLIVQEQLPTSMQVTDVFATTMTIAAAQQKIISSINSGQLLVNYEGHGSEEEWSGDDLFDNTAAMALNNGSSLPVFLVLNCLNGLFQDIYEQPLGVTLMLAPNGGAVAVLASSGLNLAEPQTLLDRQIVQTAMHAPYPALGDAIVQAKSVIKNLDVRKTFNLFGDPAMRIKSSFQDSQH